MNSSHQSFFVFLFVQLLSGQPPQRMVSEIARRVPSGGPGLVVPIGGGSGGSSEGGSSGSDGE